MSSNADKAQTLPTENDNVVTDLEARKLNDTTFDTEEESGAEDNDEDNDDGDYDGDDVRDAAHDILGQLVELFIERNGREPNEEEVLQWIGVFKSLKIEDADADEAEETKSAAAAPEAE
jgi:hypothetical protein